MRPSIRSSSILFLLVLVAACSSSDPKALTDQGTAALNSGNAKEAVADFDRALAHMDATHPEFQRASVSRCQALARIDPAKAKDDFLTLSRVPMAHVAEPDFTAVATELLRHDAIAPAAAIAEAGMKMFPESPGMKTLLDRVGDAAKKANDPESLKRLKGLGYAGSDG